MVTGLQVFHIEFEEIQRSWTCRIDRIGRKKKKRLCLKKIILLFLGNVIKKQKWTNLKWMALKIKSLCNNALPWVIQYLHPELCELYVMCCFLCMSHPRAAERSAHADVWGHVCCCLPAALPGWPSMLAKRMSELSVGYISIQADMEWSCPWSWSSSRNFWEEYM